MVAFVLQVIMNGFPTHPKDWSISADVMVENVPQFVTPARKNIIATIMFAND